MGSAFLVLANDNIKARAVHWIERAVPFTRLTFQGPRRSLPQNNKMWAMLTEIAVQARLHGMRLDASDWRLVFLAALRHELRIVPNLEGDGFVNLGASTSDLSRAEMSDMIELMYAFGARQGVVWQDHRWTPPEREAA